MRLRWIFAIASLLLLPGFSPAAEKSLDQFVRCLASKQVKMYGAYWCPHCSDQKKEFGDAFKYVSYVECAVPGKPPSEQTPACREAQIRKYPTWIFPDGNRLEQVLPLDQLSQKTGCKLP